MSLDRLRDEVAAARSWELVFEGDEVRLETTAETGEPIVLAIFVHATPEEQILMARAPDAMRQMLGIIDRASDEIRRAEKAGFITRKNYPAEAAMRCGEAAFRIFLAERAGVPVPPDAVSAAVIQRRLLAVHSRRELWTDDEAAARWNAMREEFNEWQRRERVR